MSSGPNVFFVDEKYYDRFGIEDNSPVKLGRKWKVRKFKGFPPGKEYLEIDAFKIKKQWIMER
jgi:hypothetical protein